MNNNQLNIKKIIDKDFPPPLYSSKFYLFQFIILLKVLSIYLYCFVIFMTYYNIYLNGRIFVSFMYNNEAEMAYIHIWRLYNYVDKFVIITSNKTFSGLPKNITFSPFEKKIRRFMNKVDIVNFDNICNRKKYPTENIVWCIEKSQRDFAKTYIEEHYNPTEDDLFIITDLDEVLTREGIKYIKKNPPNDFYFIKGSLYFPYYHKVGDWDVGYVVRYNKNIKTLNYYRSKKITKYNLLKYEYNPSKPLLTHCSYCFKNIEQYRNKLKSYSHQEYNNKTYTTNNWIFKSHYCREKIGSSLGYDEPYEGWRHLIPNDKRLKYLIDPSFEYPIFLTNYTKKDLETICARKYNRTPFK